MSASRRTTVVLVIMGSLLLQLAWIVAVPPFRGMDEADHVYRAEAVAAGHWWAVRQPAGYDGRGDLVRARASTVRAAYSVCHSYAYVADADCLPARTFADGSVLVASGAAHYDPLYYWVLGAPTRWLDGVARLYAMRLINALVCSLLIGLAAWATTLWSRTSWPRLGLLLVCTPVALYSGATPAPNGPEMFAAVALWSVLLGLRMVPVSDSRASTLLRAALVPAPILATVRTLGPLWLGLLVLSIFSLLGMQRTRELVRAHRHPVLGLVLVGGVTTVAAATYSLVSGANSLGTVVDHHYPQPVRNTFRLLPIWAVQTVGVFPDKIDLAPAIVYVAGFAVLGTVLVLAGRRGTSRERAVLAGVVAFSFLVPLAATLRTYEIVGSAWQGRYTWPFASGALLVATLVLDRTGAPLRQGRTATLVLVGLGPLQLPGPLRVLMNETTHGPMAGSSAWWFPDPGLMAAFVVVGLLVWLMALRPSAASATARPAAAAGLSRPSILQGELIP